MSFKLKIVLFLFLFLKIFACQAEQAGRFKIPLKSKKLAGAIELKPRWLYMSQPVQALDSDAAMAKLKPELNAITKVLSKLVLAFHQRNVQKIQELVHPREGLYVDLKAHWSYRRLIKEIQSGRGYLYEVLLSEQDPFSLYKTLQSNSQIELDYYLKENMCELKLHLVRRPEDSYLLNNPIFIYRGKQWYAHRLF